VVALTLAHRARSYACIKEWTTPQIVYKTVTPIVPQMTNFNHSGKSSIYSSSESANAFVATI
jgi:hypothetical protein